MTFFGKPSGGPDAIGGLFPRQEVQPFRNRDATNGRGGVLCLDISASDAAVDATDSNSGLPGAGDSTDDTIWNTMVAPLSGHLSGAIPSLCAVTLERIVTDGIGRCQVYGIVDEARVLHSGGGTNLVYGTPLTFTATNSFNATIAAANKVVAFWMGATNTVTNAAEIGRVFLHNGVGLGSGQTGLTVA